MSGPGTRPCCDGGRRLTAPDPFSGPLRDDGINRPQMHERELRFVGHQQTKSLFAKKRLKLEAKAKRGETKKLRKARATNATGAEGD